MTTLLLLIVVVPAGLLLGSYLRALFQRRFGGFSRSVGRRIWLLFLLGLVIFAVTSTCAFLRGNHFAGIALLFVALFEAFCLRHYGRKLPSDENAPCDTKSDQSAQRTSGSAQDQNTPPAP